MRGEVTGQTLIVAVNADTVERHLLDAHGVRYDWSSAGPCADSPIAVHNMLHWPNRHPNHDHAPRSG